MPVAKPHFTDKEIDRLLAGKGKFFAAAPSIIRQLRQRNKELETENEQLSSSLLKDELDNQLADRERRKEAMLEKAREHLRGHDGHPFHAGLVMALESVTLDGEAIRKPVGENQDSVK